VRSTVFSTQGRGSVTIDVPGAFATEPHGINNAGTIVGVYLDENLQQRGFLLDNGTFTAFDAPFPDATDTIGWGINKTGQVVGYYLGSDAVPHGFLRQPDGSFTAIDAPGAPCGTYALGIDNNGTIVGLFDDCSAAHAFKLAGGTFTTIDPPGASVSEALASPAAESSATTHDGGGNVHGFLLVKGVFTTIDVGAVATLPAGINRAGSIVGLYTDAAGNAHGFLAVP
jgi:probable HAF family extracellular repeat protein